MTTTVTITREVEITVEARYIPAVPVTRFQPPEPASIDIIMAYDQDGLAIELTDAEADEVERLVLENPPERDCD